MSGFWVQPQDVRGENLVLRGEEAHHLIRVRRQRVGDQVEAVDGMGRYFQTEVVALGGNEVVCRILAQWDERGESPVRLCLAPALVQGSRFDFLIEKATEIGVDSIAPLLTSRGVVRPGREGRVERWQRLARAAVKQCGRSRLPEILSPASLEEVVGRLQEQGRTVLLATPTARQWERRELLVGSQAGSLGLLIGPEGGFSPEEEAWARKAGVACFSWGARTLRAETAGLVLGALVLHEAEQALRNR